MVTGTVQDNNGQLVVKNLSKRFGGVEALSDVSFDVSPGQFVALIGPNGAGKTTCFNIVNGQLRPTAGSVNFKGRELTRMTPSAIWRLGVGRSFQITATYPTMTVVENVQMALISRHRRIYSLIDKARESYRDEAIELLDLVGMGAQADRACGVVAYGDLKRIEIAVALANDPKLLLMDEPTAGMAPGERIEVMALTSEIARSRDIAVLFTEHDMDTVFTHADEVLVLHQGELIARGAPDAVRDNRQVRAVYLGAAATAMPEKKRKPGKRAKKSTAEKTSSRGRRG